jgi:beta-galactosidase
LSFACAVLAALLIAAAPAMAETRSLSQDWRFHRGEIHGAEAPGFDDGDWHEVAVPHDWSIMDKPDGSPPFEPDMTAGQDSGYLAGGIGWYRRQLTLTAAEAAQVVRLNFEAVYMDADVWVNGEHLTRHAYGYTAFALDLTGKVRAGDNVIAVRVNHPDPSSRWYAGSGIIRPVTLEIVDRVHLDPDSIFVTTPVVTAERGVVAVKSAVANRSGRRQTVQLVSRVVSAQGETLAEAIERGSIRPGARFDADQSLVLSNPLLWSPAAPSLYTLVQEVRVGGATVDERRTRFASAPSRSTPRTGCGSTASRSRCKAATSTTTTT